MRTELIPATLIPICCFLLTSGCSNTHDEPIPKEVNSDLLAIWGTSDADLFAVGQAGLIMHYDGRAWIRMESGTMMILHDVSGSSSNRVFAVGMGGALLGYDGKAWKPVEASLAGTFYGIWTAPEGTAFVVGTGGTILHFDGKQWQQMSSGVTNGLLDVWGSSGTDVFAVGNHGTILHYDGHEWSGMKSPVTTLLRGVSGVSKSCVYAVGDEGVVLQYDGHGWRVLLKKDANWHWNGICAFPDGEVRVVGLDRRTGGVMMYYAEGRWGDCRTSGTRWSEINSVWGWSSTNFFTVGLDGINHRFQ